MSTHKITTYEEAFEYIGIPCTEKVKERMKKYEEEGHTEKSICFTIWKKAEKLMDFRMDSRFWSVFDNELRKYSWTKDDPRWGGYNRRKGS